MSYIRRLEAKRKAPYGVVDYGINERLERMIEDIRWMTRVASQVLEFLRELNDMLEKTAILFINKETFERLRQFCDILNLDLDEVASKAIDEWLKRARGAV